ncbi:MAG: hypothetical protein ACLGH8_14725 [Bacteroidia bacterium]
MQSLSSQIAEAYVQLVPPIDEGLLIFKLHEKIKNGTIDANFSAQDIQRILEEMHKDAMGSGSVPNRERILKNLLAYFIERPAELKSRYTLTDYARKFILLVEHKIHYPFRKFPLRESFKKYADFSADEINHINQFESWFNQGFQATTRENILDHLEELKMQVQQSVQSLNKLLYSGEETAQKIVADFSEIFIDLGDKADEIRDTLRLGNTLQQQIDLVVSKFYDTITAQPHPVSPEETTLFNEQQYGYSRGAEIRQEILEFFEVIDSKLAQLRERIRFATTKLNELQHLFRYRSQYKVNLKRLLEYALSEAAIEKGILVLPADFPIKGIVEERFKLTVMPDLEREGHDQNRVIDIPLDTAYHQSEQRQVEYELARQERIAILVGHYLEKLKDRRRLDFTDEFYAIIDQEEDEEIALQVGYELLQFTHGHAEYFIDISPKIKEHLNKKPIKTWSIELKAKS